MIKTSLGIHYKLNQYNLTDYINKIVKTMKLKSKYRLRHRVSYKI